MNVDKYNGEDDLLEYLDHFYQVADWNGWDPDEMATQLAMHLSGPARAVLADISDVSGRTFGRLVQLLRRRYHPDGREGAYKAQFRRTRKNSNESFTTYGYALRKLAARAYPKLDGDSREEMVLDQFSQGLNDDEMRKHVQFGHPTILDMAIQLAQEYEMFESSRQATKKPSSSGFTAVISGKDDKQKDDWDSRFDRLEKALLGLVNKVDTMENKTTNQQSHRTSDFPRNNEQSRTFTSTESGGQPNRTYSGSTRFTCFNCQKEGHFSRNCPEPRRVRGDNERHNSQNKENLN